MNEEHGADAHPPDHRHESGRRRHRHRGGHQHGHDEDAVIHWARLYQLQGRLFHRRERRLHTAIAERLDLRPGQRVLDVACGPGQLVLALARHVSPGGTADGVDAAEEMVELARQNAAKTTLPVTFETARAQELPFGEASFDALTCTLALHHIARDDRPTAAREFLRVLRPGGRVLLADFHEPTGRWSRLVARKLYGHALADRPVDQATELFTAAGFTDVQRADTPVSWIGFVTARKPAG